MLELNDVTVVFNEGTINEKIALSHINLHLDKGLLEVMGLENQLYFNLFQVLLNYQVDKLY